MQTHIHPQSGVTIEGVRLSVGSIIREGDKYDSTDGSWEPGGHIAGLIIQRGCTTFWVRQPEPLSANAKDLLRYLASGGRFGSGTCIGERNGNFYVIPSPTFNRDGRIDWNSQRVRHPECVQELVNHGYLEFSEHDPRNWMSDYGTVWEGTRNRVHTLTEKGKEEGARLMGN
ncbi:hypothetical protein KW783_00680 [Candidatus Parcubacteria bacterium]|nr:hypothetical protein [Candidatus Parcubacteria bacterium]